MASSRGGLLRGPCAHRLGSVSSMAGVDVSSLLRSSTYFPRNSFHSANDALHCSLAGDPNPGWVSVELTTKDDTFLRNNVLNAQDVNHIGRMSGIVAIWLWVITQNIAQDSILGKNPSSFSASGQSV